MKRYLLDSNAVNALINHREPLIARVREARMRGDRIGTCEPVVAELVHGLQFRPTRDKNILRLNRGLSRLLSWPFDRLASQRCGEIMADLQRRGLPIQMVDMMAAAIALSLGNTTVVSSDTDLSRVEGLSVENWMQTDS